MNLFEYPELCTMILQYLPTKQIVHLFCYSNTISSSMKKSSYLMGVDIMYNTDANYTNFPTQHFILCTDVYHEEDKLRNIILKFYGSKFLYDRNVFKDEYGTIDHTALNSRFLSLFDKIDPQHYINYYDPLVKLDISYYDNDDYNTSINHDNNIHDVNCTNIYGNDYSNIYGNDHTNHTNKSINSNKDKPIKFDKLSKNPNDTNCSIHINNKRNIEITGTNINDLIISNSSSISVKSKINNVVVIDDCESVTISQKYLKHVIFKDRVFDCSLNNVGVLDASTAVVMPYDRNDYECPYKHRCEHSRGITTKSVSNLHIGDYYDEDNVFKCIEHLHYTTPMKYDEEAQDYCDYSFSGLVDNNKIRNLELYIYNKLIISGYEDLERLKVSFKSTYYEYEYDHDKNRNHSWEHCFDDYKECEDKEYKKCEIDGAQMLVVRNCPNLREMIIDRSIVNIQYDVSKCKNLTSINIISKVKDIIGTGCDNVKVHR